MSDQTDYQTALRCAHLSNEVYLEFNDQFRFTAFPTVKPTLLENKSPETKADTQVAVFEAPDTPCGYVIFRGSDADRDWLNNLDFGKWSAVTDAVLNDKHLDYPEAYGQSSTGVKLHSGFTRSYFAVRSQIQDLVKASAASHWILTGHSLGGALANLCAVDLQYNLGTDVSVEVYTFGAPRVGNKAFANSYNQRVPKTWRFVNGNDVVSGLPRRWQGYRHVNQRIRFKVPFTWRIISGSLQDHRIQRYITAIQQRLNT